MGFPVGILGLVLATFCVGLSFGNEESLVPVLMWGYKNPADLKFSHNSLHNIETSSLTTHIQKIIEKSSNPLVLCFVEPILSVEDFSAQPTAFSHVKDEISQSKLLDYMPSVYSAAEGVRNLANEGFKVKEISDTDSFPQDIADIDVLIVKLSESDDDRFSTLAKHDKFISETYRRAFEQRKNVIGVLTSEISLSSIASLIRYRRDAGNSPENRSDFDNFSMKDVFVAGNNNGRAMLYAKTPATLYLPNGNKYILMKNSKTTTTLDDRVQSEIQRLLVTYFTDDGTMIKLRFLFTKDQMNKWYLKNIELESPKLEIKTNLTTSSSITSTLNHPYNTPREVEFADENKVRVVFSSGLQVQPWIPDLLGEKFGDMEEAVTYFTVGIWMGLFVMAILAVIFTLGIVMIMDIRTMDRFDDAKGKTITISATD
uniref:V-type proton ATPase subunit S1 n=1 Tax=Cacopsylla melanoneura TaxID=428564 RepID=A0A8D8S6C0_9HEMI